ncbi:sulfotransferase [Rhodopirellula sp.]|nr:sulfotransferase [Rhodopirellula sp.]
MLSRNPKAPLFIAGTQRSGTTLLHQIMSASSQVWSQNEVYPLHRPMFAAPTAKHDQQFAAAMHEFFGVSVQLSDQPLQQNTGQDVDGVSPISMGVFRNPLSPLARKHFGSICCK